MSTSAVRIRQDTHEILKELARQTGRAMSDILASAIEEYRRRHFLAGLASDFEALQSDPEAWEDEVRERDAWEATLQDNLDGD